MRILPLAISGLISIGLIYLLHSRSVLPAPLGSLLAPQSGLWQNAEQPSARASKQLQLEGLKGKVDVYFDERMVPHVFAEQETDAIFVQGYLHARDRLWQMDLQTRAAAGRVSEVIGEKGLQHDREFRRLGMVYGAENSLKEMEADPQVKAVCDAYTAGVNAYIHSLTQSSLPFEYKLIGFEPEQWSNFKTALFLKYMSYDLAAHEADFEMTNAHSYFNKQDFDLLYPLVQDSLDPIVPAGTPFIQPDSTPVAPAGSDSLYLNPVTVSAGSKPDKDNGSNNWAVSASKTSTGAPILCNDPHLGLNLPSLWYEIQINTPEYNAYGASFPGAPCVIIGFNDSCAFGFTNGGRDVRDYYQIEFKDNSRKQYKYNGEWKNTEFRYEEIKIAGKSSFIDTVAYTVFGPVMYDARFGDKRGVNKNNYAVRWKAHDASNELRIFYELDRAKNYSDYQHAVLNLHTPGQNVIFAAKNGDIAIRTQGEWPAKWKGQGDFVMPGVDSSYAWQRMIADAETPFQYNPLRGFVSSANQKPVDSTYPYYIGREYPLYRGIIVNRMLDTMQQIDVAKMKKMQTDNYNVFAQMAMPLFLKNIDEALLNTNAKKYAAMLRGWNLRNDVNATGATVFNVVWKKLEGLVFDDEFAQAPQPIQRPFESTLLEGLLKDSAWKFIDNINTAQTESLKDIITQAFIAAEPDLTAAETAGKLTWAAYKDTRVMHLAKLPELSSLHLPIGGGTHIINATKDVHGPSWRMIVSLTNETEAWGIYPGGQSGNPGSKYYNNFVNDWALGNYYRLWVMDRAQGKSSRVQYSLQFSKK